MSVWRATLSTAGTRVGVMAVSGLLGIVTSRLILQYFGVEAYAQYGLLNGVRLLLPFADLGIGAVVINVIAESRDPRRDRQVLATLTTALRYLTISGVVIAVLSLLFLSLGWWPALLGGALLPGGDVVAMLCLAVFGLSLPLGLGVRILIGLGKNSMQTAVLGLASPLFLIGLLPLIALGHGAGNYVALVSYVAGSVTSALTLLLGARFLRPQVWKAFRDAPRVRSVRNVKVGHTAWPALLMAMAMPIAMQTDRLFLSHLSTTRELANYNFASQIFGLVLQTIIAAGITLWPYFARARATSSVESPFGIMTAFVVGAGVLSAILCLALPLLTEIVTDGKLRLDPLLTVGFVALVLTQAANYPLGMYMTDPKGFQFQVVPIIATLLVNVPLTWMLVEPLGAAGPVLASAGALLVCQILPAVWWIRRDLSRRRLELRH
ncbi:hypothetical protein [Mumia sp. zg.B17]|uniref:hypothetical protein n=1 Tax=Mumia sp. zg.B17 TaxID=2855446 RepID=UPI001C6EAF9D|nr:hypothetical protein [Mumia sp. zg.B17]